MAEGPEPVAWRVPVASPRARGPWHIEGSLLGLDVCLAHTWLPRVSQRPLQFAPTIDRIDRRALAEVVPTMDPAALDDATMRTLAAAVRRGRARVAAVTTESDAEALAAALPLDALRRALLPWVFTHERDHWPSWLSTLELFRLGSGAAPYPPEYDAWGAPARPRLGCNCLRFPDARGPHSFVGHLSSGILMSAVPDLTLRVAELPRRRRDARDARARTCSRRRPSISSISPSASTRTTSAACATTCTA